MTSNSEQFSINVTGEVSGEKYPGVFKTKLRLSHRDQLRMDEIRRELLGKSPEHASPRAQNQADIISTIIVHLLDAPLWWKSSGDGLSLEDDNILGEIYGKIMEVKAEAQNKLKKEAETAKVDLAKGE